MMKNGKNIYSKLNEELVKFVESKAEELKKEFEDAFKGGKMNCFETAKGVVYLEPQGEKLVFGGMTNAGIIPEYEFDYDFSKSFDWNLQGMIEQIMEEEGYPLDESVKTYYAVVDKNGEIKSEIYDNKDELLNDEGSRMDRFTGNANDVHIDEFTTDELEAQGIQLEESFFKKELTALPKKSAKYNVGDKVKVNGVSGEIVKVKPMKLSDTCTYDIKLEDGKIVDRYEEEINESAEDYKVTVKDVYGNNALMKNAKTLSQAKALQTTLKNKYKDSKVFILKNDEVINESLNDDYIDIVVPYDLATYISNGDRTPIDFDKETYEPMFDKAEEYQRMGDVEILDDTEDYDVLTDDFGFQNHVVTIRIHKNKNESIKEELATKFKKGDIVRDEELNDLIIVDVANIKDDSEPIYMIDYYFPKGHERSSKFRKESELEKLSYTDLQQIKKFPRDSYIGSQKVKNESLTEDMKDVANIYGIDYSEFNKNHEWDSFEEIPEEWKEFITDSNKTFLDAKRFLEKRYGLFIERLGDTIESAYMPIKVHSSPYNYKTTKTTGVIELFRSEIVEINYIELAEKILKEVKDRYPQVLTKNESLKEALVDNTTFDETLLHKLMKECNAFLHNPNTENLWAKDIDKQIDALKKCLNAVKNTHLTIEKLDKLKDEMTTAVAEVEPYGDFMVTRYAKFSLGKPDKKEHITNMSLTDAIEYVKEMYLDEKIKEYAVLTDNTTGEEVVRKDWDNEYIWNKNYHNPFDESLNEAKEYPKMLASLLKKCWYGNGEYARNGQWYVGLGGYNTGYEVSYNRTPLFSIKSDDGVEMYQDESGLIRYCGYNYDQILKAIKEVEPNAYICNWDDFFEDDSEEFVLTDEDKQYLLGIGHTEEDLEQIEQAANVTKFRLTKKDKPLTKDEVIDLIGRETFLNGLSRSAFHWSAEREGISFDSSKLFESKNEAYHPFISADSKVYDIEYRGCNITINPNGKYADLRIYAPKGKTFNNGDTWYSTQALTDKAEERAKDFIDSVYNREWNKQESKPIKKSIKKALKEFYDVTGMDSVEMEIVSFGIHDGLERFELDGIEFYLGEDETLENAVDTCIEMEFLPEWQEQGLSDYNVDSVKYDKEEGKGTAYVGLFWDEDEE